MMNDIVGMSELNKKDWYLLRDAVLGVYYHNGNEECKWFTGLPEKLKQHEVGRLLFRSLYEADKEALSQAATMLTGDPKKAWFILMKS